MIRVPMDLRKKLDVQWMKGIEVGRLDESDGHVVLTPHGTVTGRSIRRLAGNLESSARSGGKDQKSCPRSSIVTGRASESVTCICAHQVGR